MHFRRDTAHARILYEMRDCAARAHQSHALNRSTVAARSPLVLRHYGTPDYSETARGNRRIARYLQRLHGVKLMHPAESDGEPHATPQALAVEMIAERQRTWLVHVATTPATRWHFCAAMYDYCLTPQYWEAF
jgi:hypothetical protein